MAEQETAEPQADGYEWFRGGLRSAHSSMDYGDASSDDLSSEWEAENDSPGHRKVTSQPLRP